MGQQKWAIMVGGHSQFNTIYRFVFFECFGIPSVVDEDIKSLFMIVYVVSKCADGFEGAKVQLFYYYVGVFGVFDEFI